MYTRPIDVISFSDVDAFVQADNRENIILDYKDDWPKHLAKVIAAMANTQGGLILVGVTEKGKTGRPDKIVGVDLGQGLDQLRQKVISTAVQGIYPPVMPEVQPLHLDSDPNRAVVVIRVDASNHTPHAVDNRTKIYIRVDSQSFPFSQEDLASLDRMEWLWERRQQTIEARNALIETAKERAAWFLPDSEPNKESQPETYQVPILRTWIVPYFYSGEEALSLNDVREIALKVRVSSDVLSGRWGFPEYANYRRSVPFGYCTYNDDHTINEYVEFSSSGLLFNEMWMGEKNQQTGWNELHFPRILSQVDGLVKFANRFYESGKVWGLVQVHASLHQVQGAVLYALFDRSLRPSELSKKKSPNQDILIMDEVVARNDLEGLRTTLIKQAARKITWAFNYAWEKENHFDFIISLT